MADFLGKMKDSLNKGVATISTGSKNVIEKTKINSFISTFEEEKKQLLEALGNKIYTYSINNGGDIPREEIENLLHEISKRIEQIAEQNKKLEELDSEMKKVTGKSVEGLTVECECGYENSINSVFCAKCGRRIG